MLFFGLAYSMTLTTQAISSSETPIDFQRITRCYIPENNTLQRIHKFNFWDMPSSIHPCVLCDVQSLLLYCRVSVKNVCLLITVRVTLRRTVSVESRVGHMTRYLLLLCSYCFCPSGASSLTRGRICHVSVTNCSSKSVVSMYIIQ
jgi:hypothetical protein